MTRLITNTEAKIFERFHESVFARDMQGHIKFWNKASASLYELPPDNAIGCHAYTLLKCECSGGIESAHSQVMADGYWHGQLSRLTGSGVRKNFDVHWSLRRDDTGQPIGILETAHEISTPKEMELRLQESEYRYRNLFQAMTASFWELDFTAIGPKLQALLKSNVGDLEVYFRQHPEIIRDFLRSTTVVDLNDHSVRLFGRGNRDEMMGSIDRYWPDSSLQVYSRSLIKSLNKQPNNIEVTRLKSLDGRELDCLFTACFSAANMSRGIILVGIIDLTEQVATRNALEIMQTELAHVVRISTLGEMTATIAHEIKQPLTAVTNLAEAGLNWLLRPEPDLVEVEKALRSIVSSTKRADNVIARIRSMALRRAPEENDLLVNEVIEEAIQFTRHELIKNSTSLTLDLEPELPAVRADRILIQQVIVNLVINAIQAMSTEELSNRTLHIKTKKGNDESIELQVLDSGPGIAPEYLDRLFESFFTTKDTGMGMGLPICRSIIEAAGGTIRLSNRENGERGALIAVTLPTSQPQ